jgi:hypothetical protein
MIENKSYFLPNNENYDDTIKRISLKDKKLKLYKGWNLLAVPVAKKFDTSNLLKDKDILWVYQNRKWEKNPKNINYGLGFWVKSDKEKTIEFNGDDYQPNLEELKKGWSLVGTGERIETYTMQSAIKIWKYSNNKWQNDMSKIDEGEGFWVYKDNQ